MQKDTKEELEGLQSTGEAVIQVVGDSWVWRGG